MPDIQRILIEIAADVQELTPAIDQLERLGEIDKKSADAFKKTNAEIAARAKVLGGVTAEQSKVTESTKQTAAAYEKLSADISSISKNILSGASSEAIEGFAEGVKDALAEAGVSAEQFEQALKDALENGIAPAPQATEKVITLHQELRKLKDEIARTDSADPKFKELTDQAAELQNKISNVNKEVKNLASDTRNIDGVVEGVQGLAGAFQIAQGSAALFGDESEDIQKSLVQLTALMNVANGLQTVGNLLQKESKAILLVTNAQQKISVALKALEGATESKNIIIRTAAIVSQKALNAAMAANPAGLLIVALGALAGALVFFTRETESAAEAQTKLNESQLQSLQLQQALAATFEKQSNVGVQKLEDELALMRAKGATAVEIAKKELEIANAKAAQFKITESILKDEGRNLNDLNEKYRRVLIAINVRNKAGSDPKIIAQLEKEAEVLKEQLTIEEDLQKKRREVTIGRQTATQNLEKAQAEEAAKALEELKKKREEAAKRQRELELQALNDKKAYILAGLTEVKEGSKQELDLKIALIQAQAEIDLFSLDKTKNTEAQRNLIVAEGTDEEKRIRLEAAKELQQAIFDSQNKAGSTDVNLISAELAAAAEGSRAQLEIKNSLVEAQADLDKLAAQQKFANSKKSVEDEKVFSSEIIRIDAETNAAKTANSKAYFDEQEKLRQEELEKIKAQQKEIEDTLKAGAFAALDAILANSAAKRQQEIDRSLDATLEGLNKEKEAELKNKNLTTAQKEKIEEKYRKKEADAKLAAWIEDKNARVSAAQMAMALAIINTLATVPYPKNIAAAVVVGGLGAIQVANIESETPPSYYKGTEYLERGNNPVGRDTIPVMAHEGERIINHENNEKYFESYSLLQKEKVTPQFAKAALSGQMPTFKMREFSPELVEFSQKSFNYTNFDIDYKKLGIAVSEDLIIEMEKNTEEVAKISKGIAELAGSMTKPNIPTISIRHAR